MVAREHEVEVDQQDEREHRLHRVQHLADVAAVVAGRAGPADHHPADHGHHQRADGRAGQRAGGVPEDREPDGGAADPHEALAAEQRGQRAEAAGALEHAVPEAGHGDRGERGGHAQRRPDAVQVQQRHQQRRRAGRDGGDHSAGGEPEGAQLAGAVPARPRDPQCGRGLQPHGRHRADDQHREQRAQLAEVGGDQQARAGDVEQVGGGLVAGDADGDQQRGEPYALRHRHLPGYRRADHSRQWGCWGVRRK
ncbi:hypothetical protein GCM10027436_71170 [Actinophytocola sediminis]